MNFILSYIKQNSPKASFIIMELLSEMNFTKLICCESFIGAGRLLHSTKK